MNWKTYRQTHLTPNDWRHDSPGCYVHQETGTEFHPYSPVRCNNGALVERWRILAEFDRSPDPDVGHVQRQRKLEEVL